MTNTNTAGTAGTKIETRHVLAGAYAAKNPKSMLTHAVVVDAEGIEVRVLCRAKVDSMADSFAGDTTATPTCPTCAARAAKLAATSCAHTSSIELADGTKVCTVCEAVH